MDDSSTAIRRTPFGALRIALRSVLGRRVLGQLLCAALLPIAALAILFALYPTRSTGESFLWVGALSALLVLALGAYQAQRFAEPLQRMLAATRRIALHDFSARIPVHGSGGDEIAQLAHAYNEMTRELATSFATLNALSQIDRTILTKPDIAKMLRGTLRYLRFVTAVDLVVVGLFEGADTLSMRLYALGAQGRSPLHGTLVALPDEARRRLATMAGASWIDQPPLPPQLQARLHDDDGIGHFWARPLAGGERIWGVMLLGHGGVLQLSDSQQALLSGVAERLEVAFATVERDRKLHALAHVDALTGLPNRPALLALLTQQLAHAHRRRCCLGVLFLDLDRFKHANDTLGHAVGDMLLQHAAERIRNSVREDDTVARLGGDEFTIVLGDLASARDAGTVARQLIKALSRPFEIDGHRIHVGASVGIAVYPADGSTGDELLKMADTAMYRAKDEGRNRFAYFEESMNLEARRRATLDRELRRALKQDEFVLHYQPQIDLQTGRVCAVEALVRWRHPQRGLLYPDAFVTFAEENGLIPEIGTWVMREACLQHQRWRAAGVPIPRVAVNVSNDQLRRPNFVRSVLYLLNLAQMPPGSIEIEVTESMFLEGGKMALDALHTLVAAGVMVAIDDFGTGYSSFGYLKTLPASVLKLDKSFLVDAAIDNDAGTIVAAMINMAHTLRKQVVAEGVERDDQLEFLRQLGCEKVQGYLFCRPLPADEIARYAHARNEHYPPATPAAPIALPAAARRDLAARAASAPGASSARGIAGGARAAAGAGLDAPLRAQRERIGGAQHDGDPAADAAVVEEVVLDEDLIEEDVIEPGPAGTRSWQLLWTEAHEPADEPAHKHA